MPLEFAGSLEAGALPPTLHQRFGNALEELGWELQGSNAIEFGDLLVDAFQTGLAAVHAQLVKRRHPLALPHTSADVRRVRSSCQRGGRLEFEALLERHGRLEQRVQLRASLEGDAFEHATHDFSFELTLGAAQQAFAETKRGGSTRVSRNLERSALRNASSRGSSGKA